LWLLLLLLLRLLLLLLPLLSLRMTHLRPLDAELLFCLRMIKCMLSVFL